ncbi:MAG: diaminopimelate decarboxylase [Actinomycetota bacterium]|nr:diaminopimelate decarboxylase [Actinomycetota bacterium]
MTAPWPSGSASAGPFPTSAMFVGGRLIELGGVAVADLAARFGTPLYVLERTELVGRMRAYRQVFGDEVAVAYGAKALCVTGVLQLAAAEGLHLDVASAGELRTAERAGYPMARVVLHGNNKSDQELEQALALGVGRIVVDSPGELERLGILSGGRERPVDVLLRITPGVDAGTHEFIATGHDESKFGFSLSAGLAHAAVERALLLPGVHLRGLHCHLGSQITDAAAFEAGARVMTGLLADLRDRFGATLDELNLGGGLGVAYTRDDAVPSLDAYCAALRGAVQREAAAHRLPPPRLTVEPGRSIVGPAGCTVYRIGTIKPVPGVRTFVSVDGGMSDNLRPMLYGARYEFVPAGPGPPVDRVGPVTVVGKHCETGDVLGRGVQLPADLTEGELLAVAATGAYGHAMASNYNRLPRPAMVLVGDGRAHLLVRRETLDDVLSRDVPLEEG